MSSKVIGIPVPNHPVAARSLDSTTSLGIADPFIICQSSSIIVKGGQPIARMVLAAVQQLSEIDADMHCNLCKSSIRPFTVDS